MGQAKQRREMLREIMLDQSKKWDFSPSSWEATVCAELREKEKDLIVVQRASAEQLAWARMPANQCHANARWYAVNDPSRKAKAVAGWWVQWPNFVFHSVIETNGTLICITPSPFNEKEIPFIPDPEINWVEEGEAYSGVRNQQIIGPGVRMFPAFTMAQNAIVRERLLAGGNPLTVGYFTNEEIEELKRRCIPT